LAWNGWSYARPVAPSVHDGCRQGGEGFRKRMTGPGNPLRLLSF
jgi:hypothetical protein